MFQIVKKKNTFITPYWAPHSTYSIYEWKDMPEGIQQMVYKFVFIYSQGHGQAS
jgi:hypothetical protein